MALDRPADRATFCSGHYSGTGNAPSDLHGWLGDRAELADAALDRPAEAGMLHCRGSISVASNLAAELAVRVLDRPADGLAGYTPYRQGGTAAPAGAAAEPADGGDLGDELLDRADRAPSGRCWCFCTGVMEAGDGLADLADATLDRATGGYCVSPYCSRGCQGTAGDAGELADAALDRPADAATFSCLCCHSKYCGHAGASDDGTLLTDALLDRPAHPGLDPRDTARGRPAMTVKNCVFCQGCSGPYCQCGCAAPVDLSDAALDRPADAGALCCRGSGYCPQVNEVSARARPSASFGSRCFPCNGDLSDVALDAWAAAEASARPGPCACCPADVQADDGTQLSDALGDIVLDHPTSGGASGMSGLSGLCPKCGAPDDDGESGDDLADAAVDRVGRAGFSSPCCSIKFSGDARG